MSHDHDSEVSLLSVRPSVKVHESNHEQVAPSIWVSIREGFV